MSYPYVYAYGRSHYAKTQLANFTLLPLPIAKTAKIIFIYINSPNNCYFFEF